MQAFKASVSYWLNPLKWARNMTFLLLLAIDFKHSYEYVISQQVAHQAREAVILFGPLFTALKIPMTNGVFDALSYAFIVTATIYFVSNTLAKRLANNHPSLMYYFALGVGVGISALTNAGTMYYGATGTPLIPVAYTGVVAALLGGVVTAGLLMFASMDAWDMKARIEKARATRAKNKSERDELAAKRADREKYIPKKYRVVQG